MERVVALLHRVFAEASRRPGGPAARFLPAAAGVHGSRAARRPSLLPWCAPTVAVADDGSSAAPRRPGASSSHTDPTDVTVLVRCSAARRAAGVTRGRGLPGRKRAPAVRRTTRTTHCPGRRVHPRWRRPTISSGNPRGAGSSGAVVTMASARAGTGRGGSTGSGTGIRTSAAARGAAHRMSLVFFHAPDYDARVDCDGDAGRRSSRGRAAIPSVHGGGGADGGAAVGRRRRDCQTGSAMRKRGARCMARGGSLEYSTRATPTGVGRRCGDRAEPHLPWRAPRSPLARSRLSSLYRYPQKFPPHRFSSRRLFFLMKSPRVRRVLRALLDELAEALAQDRDDGLVEILTHGHALGHADVDGAGAEGAPRSRLGRGGLGGGGVPPRREARPRLGLGGGSSAGAGSSSGAAGASAGSRPAGGAFLRREGVGMGRRDGSAGHAPGGFFPTSRRGTTSVETARELASVDARRTSAGASSAGGVSSQTSFAGASKAHAGVRVRGTPSRGGAGVARNADTRTAEGTCPSGDPTVVGIRSSDEVLGIDRDASFDVDRSSRFPAAAPPRRQRAASTSASSKHSLARVPRAPRRLARAVSGAASGFPRTRVHSDLPPCFGGQVRWTMGVLGCSRRRRPRPREAAEDPAKAISAVPRGRLRRGFGRREHQGEGVVHRRPPSSSPPRRRRGAPRAARRAPTHVQGGAQGEDGEDRAASQSTSCPR